MPGQDELLGANEYDDVLASERAIGSTATPAANEYDAILQGDRATDRTRLRASLMGATKVNPDQAAEANELGQRTGLPAPVVERNLDEVRTRATLNEYDKLLDSAPALARRLGDPAFAKVAHDDAGPLAATEDVVRKSLGQSLLDSPAELVKGLGGSYNALAASAALVGGVVPRGADWLRGLATGRPQTEAQDAYFRATLDPLLADREAFQPDAGARLPEKVMNAFGGAFGFLSQVVLGGGGGPAPALPATAGVRETIVGAAETGVRGGAVPALSSAVNRGREVFEATGDSTAAVRAAVAEYEATTLAVTMPLSAPGNLLTRVASGGASGLVSTEVSYQITDAAAPPEMRVPLTADDRLVGTITGSVLAIAGPHQQRVRSAKAAEQDAAALVRLQELAAASKLVQRDPAAFEAFVDAAAAEGSVTDVYVDARLLTQTLAQSGVVSPEEVARTLPTASAGLAEALATGGDVRIPLGEFAARVASTEAGAALLPHLRTSPDAMTQDEARTFMQNGAAEFRAQAERVLAVREGDDTFVRSTQAVEDDVFRQLQGANRFTKDVDGAYAALTSTFYATLAQRLKLTPEEAYQRYPLRITAESVDGQTLAQLSPEMKAIEQRFEERLAQLGPAEIEAEYAKQKDAKGGRVLNTDAMRELSLDYQADRSQSAAVHEAASREVKRMYAERLQQEPEPGRLPLVLFTAGGTGAGKSTAIENVPSVQSISDQAQIIYDTNMSTYASAREKVQQALDAGKNVTIVGVDRDPVEALVEGALARARRQTEQLGSGRTVPVRDHIDTHVGWAKVVKRLAAEYADDPRVEVLAVDNKRGRNNSQPMKLADVKELDYNAVEPAVRAALEKEHDEGRISEAIYRGFKAEADAGGRGGDQAVQRADRSVDGGHAEPPRAAPGSEAPIVRTLAQAARSGGQTDTPAFKKWFGDWSDPNAFSSKRGKEKGPVSYAVNKDGTPRIFYHGTRGDFNAFEANRPTKNSGTFGSWDTSRAGIFFTPDPENATPFTSSGGDKAGGNIMPVYLDIKSPIDLSGGVWRQSDLDEFEQAGINPRWLSRFDWSNFDDADGRAFVKAAKELGYDGVIFNDENPDTRAGTESWVVFEPTQIKSAIGNRGAFDPQDPNILNQDSSTGRRAQITLGEDLVGDPTTITLLKNADLTSFLHESGHFYLEVLNHAARQAAAAPELVADAQALLGWFGVKDAATWDAMTLEQRRPHHEKFARGFEAYLFEGKAPSVELGSLFDRFRAWMLNTYKRLRALDVELTPEVRGVMDRMLATREQVRAAEDARSYAPLFKTPEELAATGTKLTWDEYQSLGAQATADAEATLERRGLRDMQWLSNARGRALKGLQKEADARRKVVAEQAQAEVRQRPVYAAGRFLTHGEVVRDGEEVQATTGHKLSLPALREAYPAGELTPLDYERLGTGKRGMTAENGLDPNVVAEAFGFSSGDELVRSLLSAEPEAQVVEALTDQRMLERHGDLADPAALARAADEAVHNEARARFVATELDALAKATGQPRVLATAAREFARQAVSRQKVRDVRPLRHVAAEVRAARSAEKAKTLQEKATEKRNQLVQHYAARASYDALAEVERGLRKLRSFESPGTRENLDSEYLDQIDKLLERFDLRKITNKEADRRRTLAQWAEAQAERGNPSVVDEALLDEANRKPYRELTVEEFRGLVDAVRNVEHLGRLKNKLLTAREARAFDEVVKQIAQSTHDKVKGTVPERRSTDRGILPRAAAALRWTAAIHRKFSSLTREMDGFEDGGPAWEHLVRNMNEAGGFEAVEREKATLAYGKLLEPVTKRGGLTKRRYFPSIGRSYSPEEVIGIAHNLGNEVNRERVMTGEKLSPAQLSDLLSTLRPEDLELVKGTWALMESYRPRIAEKEKRLTGVEPSWVEPKMAPELAEVAARLGVDVGDGGYYPIAYDPLLDTRSAADVDAQVQRQMTQGLYTRAQTARGHLKERVASTGRPLRFDFAQVVTRHLNQVIHDLAWHEYLIDANRLLGAKAIDSAIRERLGPEALSEMRDALRDVAIDNLGSDRGSRAFDHLRYGTSIASLGLNVFNALQNLTGIGQSMSRVGSGWVLRGAAHWLGDAAKLESSVAKMHAKSDVMRLRGRNLQREVSELRNKVTGGDSKLQAAYFYLQTKTQLLVDVPTWWGAYEKAMADPKNRTDDKRAVALADQAVLDAQGGGQVKDLSGVQRGSSGLKLFTTFYHYFNTTFNNTAEAYGRTDFKKPAQVALFAADMVLLYAAPALLSTLLRAGLQGEWDDEKKLVKRIAADQISYLLGTVVLLREATAGVQAAAGVDPGFGYSGPSSTRFFSDLYRLGQQVNQGEADAAFWKSLNNVGGVLFHYPAGQINRTVEGFEALREGRTRNPLAIVMGPPKP